MPSRTDPAASILRISEIGPVQFTRPEAPPARTRRPRASPPAHPGGREPERRRRQDHDHHQPRHRPGGRRPIRAADRPRSAGQRLDRTGPRAQRPGNGTYCAPEPEKSLAEVIRPTYVSGLSIVAGRRRPRRRRNRAGQRRTAGIPAPRRLARPTRPRPTFDLRPDRLPTQPQPAHPQRPRRRRCRARPAAVRVLRPRRHQPDHAHHRTACGTASTRSCASRASC